jgi:exonuclease III
MEYSCFMKQTFRIVTWNCRHASLTSGLWDYLLELDPDVALLQDFGAIPDRVMQHYVQIQSTAVVDTSRAPLFMTGILVKGISTEDIALPVPTEWVARELEISKEFFTARSVTLHNGISLKVLSVYSPAFPIDRTRLAGIDTNGIRLSLQNHDVWVTELLWATLKSMSISAEEPFIMGGDLNSSETIDNPRPRGNREVMDRMNALGFYDCLRMFKGRLIPTFRHSGGSIVHQLDHLYVTPTMLSRLAWCDVGSAEHVFGSSPMLSDHLPIVADFTWPL